MFQGARVQLGLAARAAEAGEDMQYEYPQGLYPDPSSAGLLHFQQVEVQQVRGVDEPQDVLAHATNYQKPLRGKTNSNRRCALSELQ